MPATSVRCSVPTSTVQLQQLLRLRHALGGQHLRDAQLDFHEVFDARCASASAACGGRRAASGAGDRARRRGWRRWRRRLGGWCWLRGSAAIVLNSSTDCSMRGNKACVVADAGCPARASPLFSDRPRRPATARRRASRSVRSPVPGMNGRTSSAITRTVSAATYSAVSSSSRFAASFASTHGSRVTMYRFVAPITSQISRSAELNWNDRRSALTLPIEARRSPAAARASGARASSAASAAGTMPAAVPMNHRRRAAHQVAEIVGEVGVVPRQERFVGEAGVLAEDHLAQHEVAERVEAEPVDVVLRPDDVAHRLGHLRAVHQPPAVADELARERQVRGHQERRPVDRVLPDDLLADQVHVGRPVALRTWRLPWSSPP